MAVAEGGKTANTIEAWLNERSDWLRRAASEYLENRRAPNDAEIAALADHCLLEAQAMLGEASKTIDDGAIEAVPAGGEIRLKSVGHVLGVNALISNAVLNVDTANLTVIYGTNGSGKTGYARLIKELCGAHAKDDRLYSNVFTGDNTPPQATVVLAIDGELAPAIEWKMAGGPIRTLVSTVQVFDSTAATLFTDKSNPATHAPRAMRFVSGLINISDRVAAELRERKGSFVSKLPLVPEEHANTPAAAFFEKASQWDPEQIGKECTLPENTDTDISELANALEVEDPATKIAELSSSLLRNADIRQTCDGLVAGLGDAAIAAVVAIRKDAITKRSAATAFSKELFQGVPLAGVGEPVWRELWTHAKQYSEEVAYPQEDFPVLGDEALCVLCQQQLSDDAKGRMKSFSQYLEGALESAAINAEKLLIDEVAAFVLPPETAFWQLLESATGLTSQALLTNQHALASRFAAAGKAEDSAGLEIIDFSAVISALHKENERIERARAALIAVAGAQGRQQKKTQLAALNARKWLASVKPSLLEECDRQATLKLLDDAAAIAVTNSLTKKVNDIANDYLVAGYLERFNLELATIGGGEVRVELKAKAEGKGRFSFSLDLQGAKTSAAPRLVLSEGEQRAVALASFLADVTGAARSAPIIFDDPISSLDQDLEERVATRLVALSQTRQVIVFTHRLSMMTLLQDAAKKLVEFGQPVSVAVQVVARTAAGSGTPSEIDIFSQKPKAGLNNLIQAIDGLGKVPAEVEPYARAGLCSTFRLFLEKIVEYHLCADVISRYRRDVQTKNKIAKLALVTPDDCQLIDKMMSKYSGFVHSQAQEAPATAPNPQVLKDDVSSIKTWLEGFEQRAKEA